MTIRRARLEDLPALMAIFAADALGGHGDSADPAVLPEYQAAFQRIEASPNDALYVAELGGEVVGTFQTTLIVSLTARGSANLTVEAVQTRNDMRGKGIGAAMMRFAIDEGRRLGARQVQLMSNATRSRRPPLLRTAGLRQEPCRLQDEAAMRPSAAASSAASPEM